MKLTTIENVAPKDLTVEGFRNSRLTSEPYYAECKGGRTDVWVSQVLFGKKHIANVFFEVGSRPPQVDICGGWSDNSPRYELDQELRDEVLRLAKANFDAFFTAAEREAHVAFFKQMVEKHGIFWKE